MNSDIAIVTSTSYNLNIESDRLRANLAKKFIKKANASGYRLFLVDENSEKSLVEEFSNLGAEVLVSTKRGMGYCRRQAINLGFESGSKVLVWSEPEKEPFIDEILKSAEPILTGRADFVVPKRMSMQSYPKDQQYLEPFSNLLFSKLTGLELDITFGPRLFRKEKANYFLDYGGEYGDSWDAVQIPIVNAVFKKEKIVGVDINYTHPREQTNLEENNLFFYRKRLDQLILQSHTLETHWAELTRN